MLKFALTVGLQKVAGTRDLQGAFEAFKFSDTSVVRFQVNVQFCVDDCNPVNCADGIQSYGRRRRDLVTRGPTQVNVTDNVTLPPHGTTNMPEPYASRSENHRIFLLIYCKQYFRFLKLS